MTLLTASNTSLLLGVFFGVVFLIAFGIATVKAIINLVEDKVKENKVDNVAYVVVGLFLFGVGCYIVSLEFNLLYNYKYIEGTTVQYCVTGEEGVKSIEFEYQYLGKNYVNCNPYNPIENIVVPEGKFEVRISDFNPSIGRMDFDKPLTANSRNDK